MRQLQQLAHASVRTPAYQPPRPRTDFRTVARRRFVGIEAGSRVCYLSEHGILIGLG